MNHLKSFFKKLILILISVSVTLFLCEFIFRKILFSDNDAYKNLRKPGDYADSEWDANYWKLAQIWGVTKPPKPNPLIGWGYEFWQKSLLHPDIEHLGKRRPVLIYGDSFANCIDSTQCFEDYLNNDSSFAKNNYLINYGTGGYGVDQIYTLMKNSHRHYKNGFVVFSFLTFDMDRTGLSFREGQKPLYSYDKNGELILDSSKFNPDPGKYLEQNPPRIKSYLWKKFLYGKMNFLSASFTQSFKGELQQREILKKLNTTLIHEAAKELRESKTDFVFLIFQGFNDFTMPEKDNWRIQLVKGILEEEKIPFIWAKDLIKDNYKPEDPKDLDRFLIPGDGHPTSYFNKIIAEEIKKVVLENESRENYSKLSSNSPVKNNFYYAGQVDSIIHAIQSDAARLSEVQKMAKEKNISVEDMFQKHALYLLWDKNENR